MIDQLCGNIIDFERDLYEFLLERYQAGIVFDKEIFRGMDEPILDKIVKAETVFEKGCILLDDTYSLEAGLFPFGIRFIKTYDDIIVSKVEDNYKVKIIHSQIRSKIEDLASIYDVDQRIKSRTRDVFNEIRNLNPESVHISQKDLLVRLGLIEESDFELKPNKVTKGFIKDNRVKEKIEKFILRGDLGLAFDSYQQLDNLTRIQKRLSPNINDMYKKRMARIESIWTEPIIKYQSLLNLWFEI